MRLIGVPLYESPKLMHDSDRLPILLYGDFAWDHLASSYQRAFEAIGHNVIPFDTRDADRFVDPWLRNRVGHRLSIRSLSLRRFGSRRWNENLIAVAREARPGLLLILNGELIMPETLRAIRGEGIPVFILHADNPFPPHYNYRPETLPCARESDCYFIWSRMLVQRLLSVGVSRAEYLPFGWDPCVFPHGGDADGSRYDSEIVFIGGWDTEREAWLSPLAERFDLRIWGPPYWGTRTRPRSPLRRCWQGRTARGAEAGKLLRRSRIALNVLRHQNLPDGVIMRTFELPGCGAFSLSTRTSAAVEVFPEGTAGAYFSTPEELREQVAQYLSDDHARRHIVDCAHRIVRRSHTYTHRAQHILELYDKLNNRDTHVRKALSK